ncbi:hypothetical protein KQH77_00310 [Streptococcus sanguinis]|jgi:hypothetical protein|uniref:hypothetical protein n=1 Tax=Streptococcus sanguinis TaxID=1305 RepID=UPI000F6805A4|nr:hypothetical protein [Streptococcus sanguinis]RSI55962.1 hypothetical protein D8870_01165 [Streptococcus sanguinis]
MVIFKKILEFLGVLFIIIGAWFCLNCLDKNIFYNSKHEFQWSAVSSLAAIVAVVFTIITLVVNTYVTIRNSDKSISANLILKNKQDWIEKTIDAVIDLQKSYRWVLRADYSGEIGHYSEEKEKSYAEFQGSVSRLKFLFILKSENSDFEQKDNILNMRNSLSRKIYKDYHDKRSEEEKSRIDSAKEENNEILSVLKKKENNDSKIAVIIDLLSQIFDNINSVGKKKKTDDYQINENYSEYQRYLDILTDGISLFIAIEQKEIEEKIKK